MPKKPDSEMAEFEAALLRSVKQAVDGQYARVNKPDKVVSRRGRPVGSTAAVRKSATIIWLDEDSGCFQGNRAGLADTYE